MYRALFPEKKKKRRGHQGQICFAQLLVVQVRMQKEPCRVGSATRGLKCWQAEMLLCHTESSYPSATLSPPQNDQPCVTDSQFTWCHVEGANIHCTIQLQNGVVVKTVELFLLIKPWQHHTPLSFHPPRLSW